MDYIVAIDRRGEANKGMRMEREGEGMKMAQQGGKTWHKKSCLKQIFLTYADFQLLWKLRILKVSQLRLFWRATRSFTIHIRWNHVS